MFIRKVNNKYMYGTIYFGDVNVLAKDSCVDRNLNDWY